MPKPLHNIALLAVAGIALVRTFSVLLFTVRTLLRRRDFVAAKLGWVEYTAIPEPILLALGGGLFSLWALRSLPSMGNGHYVLPDQGLVEKGP